jgi:hypothetical protein
VNSDIKSVDLGTLVSDPPKTISQDTLVGEIDGLRTVFHSIAPHDSLRLEGSAQEGRVYLFTAGNGTIYTEDQTYEIGEIAFFAPRHNVPFTIKAATINANDTPLACLELITDLTAACQAELAETAAAFPMFLPYSACKTYKERIKSDKTVSRTILPEFTFPKLCLGSVQTTGDDRVAPHKHPMLEQLFFGLADNDCVLTADEVQMEFKEDILLHVPLGSTHGVEVHAPKKLHYIWIDFFKDKKGMDWIVQEHIHDD